MEDWQRRLTVEHSELSGRVHRLESFIRKPEFGDIEPVSRALLLEQLEHMQRYLAVLTRRVNRFEELAQRVRIET